MAAAQEADAEGAILAAPAATIGLTVKTGTGTGTALTTLTSQQPDANGTGEGAVAAATRGVGVGVGGGDAMGVEQGEDGASSGLHRSASGTFVRVRSDTLTSADGSNQSTSGTAVGYQDVIVEERKV